MREVYENVREVIVSLGESSPVIDIALTELQSVNKIFDAITPTQYTPFEIENLISVGLPASESLLEGNE